MTSQIIKIAQHNKNLDTSFPKDNSCIRKNSEDTVLLMLSEFEQLFSIYVPKNTGLDLWKIITKPLINLKKNNIFHSIGICDSLIFC